MNLTHAEYDAMLAKLNQATAGWQECAIELGQSRERVKALEAALRLIAGAKDVRGCDEIARQALGLTAETGAQPGVRLMEPEPQDYKVQCICGWMGQVSTLKSLPGFKMGCPDCSAEFVPLNKMTFPVKIKGDAPCR